MMIINILNHLLDILSVLNLKVNSYTCMHFIPSTQNMTHQDFYCAIYIVLNYHVLICTLIERQVCKTFFDFDALLNCLY